MDRPPGERAVILFDGVCALCNTGADWIRARDRRGRFEYLPYQSEEARRRFPGLDPARLAEAMHVVFPDGTVRAGVDAAPWIFGELSGHHWCEILHSAKKQPPVLGAKPNADGQAYGRYDSVPT